MFAGAGVVGVDTTTIDPDTTIMDPVAAGNFLLKILWIGGIFLCIVLTTVKISILLFYHRIFVTKILKRSVDVMIFILSCFGIGNVLSQIICGDPISSAWDVVHINFRFDYWDYSLAVAGISIIFDVMVLCFPIPIIRQLQLPTYRKLSVLAIFWLGAFCCIAAAVRFHALYESIQMEKYVNVTNYNEKNSAQIWQHIEPSCSIIAACLRTYGNLFAGKNPLLQRFRSFFSFSLSTRRNESSNDRQGSEKKLTLSASSKSQKSQEDWQGQEKSHGGHDVQITAQRSAYVEAGIGG